MNTYDQRPVHPPMLETIPAVVVGLVLVTLWLATYIGHARYYFSYRQLLELFCYFTLTVVGSAVGVWYLATKRSRREEEWPMLPSFSRRGKMIGWSERPGSRTPSSLVTTYMGNHGYGRTRCGSCKALSWE